MRKLLVAVGLFMVGLTGPVHAQFCPGVSPWVFDDVPASDSACPAISWMALNGISLGCQILGPLDRNYCPNDSVTRKQMALFMNRLGNIRVQEVDTGPGLAGGPITQVGTIGLTATQLLPTTACANGQVPQWNGTKWTCATGGGTGTVTSVAAGTGLVAVPSPITGSGTLNVALSYQLPQGCSNGQVAKSNGSGGWTCAADSNSGGTVTSITAGAGLAGGTITASGTIAVDPASATLTGNFFKQGGNAFGTTAALGTTDTDPLELHVANARALRIEPPGNPSTDAPNIIGGFSGNSAAAGIFAATIAGGGSSGSTCGPSGTSSCANSISKNYGAVGGGVGNTVGSPGSTVGGGYSNTANGYGGAATVGGGDSNTASFTGTTVGGGVANTASNYVATVGGGYLNTASGYAATVTGGYQNTASGTDSTVGGGYQNTASGRRSVAFGTDANAAADGCFVFADDVSENATNCSANTFVARATGGVTFITSGTSQSNYNGLYVPAGGGAWIVFSDRNYKENLKTVNGRDVLKRVVDLPIATWNWTTQSASVRHMGPTAQDFYAAFGLGDSDKGISTVDPDGVALAAIQGLYAELKERDATIAELRERVTQLESLRLEMAALRNAMAAVTRGAAAAQADATAP